MIVSRSMEAILKDYPKKEGIRYLSCWDILHLGLDFQKNSLECGGITDFEDCHHLNW